MAPGVEPVARPAGGPPPARGLTRLASGAALLAAVAAVIWLLPAPFAVALAGAALLVTVWEYAGLARTGGLDVPRVPTALAALAAGAAAAFEPPALAGVLLAALLLLGGAEIGRGGGGGALERMAASAFAAIYLALPFGVIVDLRLDGGREALTLLLATVIASDTAQYYGGRTLGRRRLAPTVSPRKTVEGAVCGVAAAALLLGLDPGGWLAGTPPAGRVLLGAGVAAAGIAGDLFESKLKRASGVKDASALIPGHGGLLDRVDGLLFAAPVFWLALKLPLPS